MDYLKHYNSLISKGKNRNLSQGIYTENHHIVPKSEGGSDELTNIVRLTAREHFLAHWLLYRMDPDNTKRAHSFWRMCRGRGKVLPANWITVSSRVYEEARLAHSKAISKQLKGRKKTPEHIAKVVAATTGKKRTVEAKAKMSEAAKKRDIPSGFYTMLQGAAARVERSKIAVVMIDPATKQSMMTFDSLLAAAKYVNRNSANICVAIQRESKSGGFLWKKL